MQTKGRTQPGPHAQATTLIVGEMIKAKENHRMTVQVIEQVEGEFRFRGFRVSLSKTTINKYVVITWRGSFRSRGDNAA